MIILWLKTRYLFKTSLNDKILRKQWNHWPFLDFIWSISNLYLLTKKCYTTKNMLKTLKTCQNYGYFCSKQFCFIIKLNNKRQARLGPVTRRESCARTFDVVGPCDAFCWLVSFPHFFYEPKKASALRGSIH